MEIYKNKAEKNYVKGSNERQEINSTTIAPGVQVAKSQLWTSSSNYDPSQYAD